MKKFTILIPIYNDWDSLEKLLANINDNIKNIQEAKFNCVIVDDCSTVKSLEIKIPSNISSVEIIHMKQNRGHARCNAFGVKYLSKKLDLDYVILMDGDGEDRPEEIKLLVDKIQQHPDNSVVAKRIKRSEGPLFQSLYQTHKYLTLLSTGKLINFGNYSCLTKNDLETLSTKPSLWSSFSGSFKKYIKNYNEVNSIRGMRYFGPSQMSFFKLIIHSLSIIAVFKYRVLLKSIILLILLQYLTNLINLNFLFFQTTIVMFNLFIFIVSFRENKTELRNSELNIRNIDKITH
ncbi:glycosyltransferase [Pelagibacteraceae bacterium]|nr:glycosyltransferase [Pelagibacteraceae bacterium]